MLKGSIWEMKAFEHLWRCPLIEMKRMGGLDLDKSSRKEHEVSMPKRNGQFERDIQQDAKRRRQVCAQKSTN
jgi:hypothetical protein